MNDLTEADVLLIDNGSRRAGSTLSLRRLAATLSARVGRTIHPVSLQHADRVDASALDGKAASLLPQFLRERLSSGQRAFVTVPLFFGPSRALSNFIPEQVRALSKEFGPFRLEQADVLCPLPVGEPVLVDILADNVAVCGPVDRVIVVDHGSPIPEVTAVRNWVAGALRARLAGVVVDEAVMERREGMDYDFNGDLLADRLAGLTGKVGLAMVFIAPGRHAGPGGDIAEICEAAEQANPGLTVVPSPLVGEHPRLLELLADRLDAALDSDKRVATAAD